MVWKFLRRILAALMRWLLWPQLTAPALVEMEKNADDCIGLARALEQQRAVKIAEAVAALSIGAPDAIMPTAFQSGFQSACEEIIHRLETEEWTLTPPADGGVVRMWDKQWTIEVKP